MLVHAKGFSYRLMLEVPGPSILLAYYLQTVEHRICSSLSCWIEGMGRIFGERLLRVEALLSLQFSHG